MSGIALKGRHRSSIESAALPQAMLLFAPICPVPARGDRGRPLPDVAAGAPAQGAAGDVRPDARTGRGAAAPAEAAEATQLSAREEAAAVGAWSCPEADVRNRRRYRQTSNGKQPLAQRTISSANKACADQMKRILRLRHFDKLPQCIGIFFPPILGISDNK